MTDGFQYDHDDRSLAAAILSLAVQDRLVIGEQRLGSSPGTTRLVLERRRPKTLTALAPDESTLLGVLFRAGPRLVLDATSQERIAAARRAHHATLRRQYTPRALAVVKGSSFQPHLARRFRRLSRPQLSQLFATRTGTGHRRRGRVERTDPQSPGSMMPD